MNSIQVKSVSELNTKINEFQAMGYELTFKSDVTATLTRKNYNLGLLILLIFFGIIPGILYYVLAGKDEVMISIIESSNAPYTSENNIQLDAPSVTVTGNTCPNCGMTIFEDSNFCTGCGSKLNRIETITCSNCNNSYSPDFKFCPHCGNENKAAGELVCSACGNVFENEYKFCPKCGAKVDSKDNDLKSEDSKENETKNKDLKSKDPKEKETKKDDSKSEDSKENETKNKDSKGTDSKNVDFYGIHSKK